MVLKEEINRNKDMTCGKIYRKLLFPVIALALFSCGGGEGKNAEESYAGKRLVETGELAAINNVSINVDRVGLQWYEMKIIDIVEHGSIVKKGDSLVKLDADQIKKMIVDKETNLETQKASLEKMLVDQESNIRSLEMELKSSEATFELQKIKLESSSFESDRVKRISELQFEQAKISFEKEKRKLALTKIINEYDLRIQQIRLKQLEDDLNETHRTLSTLDVLSPIDGVFEINRTNTGLLKEGDVVYPTYKLGNVPDLAHMKVNTRINENDFLKLRVGQKVAVRLDAMPKLVFDGEITYIGKLCKPIEWNSRQKIFDVEVRIQGSDERLKPGMTVSCEFL